MDTVTAQARSHIMSAVRGKGTRLENEFARVLKQRRLGRFTRNPQNIYGHPDFVFIRPRVAIFLDSCFWHGCHWHCRMPASNQTYWRAKLERNRARDRRVTRRLRQAGWIVLRVWEHQFAHAAKRENIFRKIQTALDRAAADAMSKRHSSA